MLLKEKGPGKWYRKGLTHTDFIRLFPDDASAEKWIASIRWTEQVACPRCGSTNVKVGTAHKTMPYRCHDKGCKKWFSVRTGTPMGGSNLGYQIWVLAIYFLTTNLKGISSMKLHRDLGITQKSAWHLAHRIRKGFKRHVPIFEGPVEADETFIGGKEANKHASKKRCKGRGTVGKTAVAGIKDRKTNKVKTTVVQSTDKPTLQGFVKSQIETGSKVYTDEAVSYQGLANHKSIKHSVGEYVNEMAHTNGIESYWASLKRGYQGVYHFMSPQHLAGYVNEFEGRHNDRRLDTVDQMANLIRYMESKQLKYKELVN